VIVATVERSAAGRSVQEPLNDVSATMWDPPVVSTGARVLMKVLCRISDLLGPRISMALSRPQLF
jgi:hypothetical protein